jgi:soluble lytic murein transglycosylase
VDAPELLLIGVEELVRNGDFDQAALVLQKVQLSAEQQAGKLGCQSRYLLGKILAGQRKWGEAADALIPTLSRCATDAEFHASLLFNAGKYAAADGRDSAAVRYYEELESKYQASSLADDARLRRAQSYRDMGAQARFVELLASMPEDYPDGDMTLEGILTLALDQMISHKWSEAASVLERAAAVVRNHDSARGHEYAGTERYFLARCLMELGEEKRALDEYEELIVQVPLSYYMLHAYSRLLEADKQRARATLKEAAAQALRTPFEFPYRPEYDLPEFRRAMELLTVGEFALGKESLAQLSSGDGADDSLLWGIALLFDQALDAHHGHQLARGRLTDWLAHYPQGDWQRPWEIGFPRPYLTSVERESKASGVPAWLIYGVMREESTFVPDIVSPAHAYGLMQIIEPTARGIGRKFNLPYSTVALKRPASNIAIGSRVLAELGKRFKKNPLLAIPGYNAGPGRPGRWLSERPNIDFDLWVETIPIRETRRYTKRVLASRAAYAFLYYPDSVDTALVLPKRLNVN